MSEEKQTTKQKKTGWIIGILVASLVVLAYVMTAFYFQSHLGFRTYVNGVDCSLCSAEQIKGRLSDSMKSYRLMITGRNNVTDQISSQELALTARFDDASLAEVLISQSALLWPETLFVQTDLQMKQAAVFQDDALATLISDLKFFEKANIVSPVSACLSEYHPETNSFTIIADEPGSEPDFELTHAAIADAISNLSTTMDLDVAGCYRKPTITADDERMINLANKANTIVQSKIVYQWNGNEVTVDKEQIISWMEVRGMGIYFDEEPMKEFLAECSYANDTYGKSATFTCADGSTRELMRSSFGWKCDREAELAQLKKDIQTGETITREPIYSHTAPAPGAADYGTSYVEVNLSAQHVYVWMNGQVEYETDCVSGNMSNGNGTPQGIYGITYKERDAILRGDNYATHVNYWMPFNGNVGMHDATWRSEFGGEIYLTSGSHGCVNLPYSAAKTIYDYMEKGFPVICYY